MTLATITAPLPGLDRFTVTASSVAPAPYAAGVRSAEVEEAWLPYLGPCPLLFARRCDQALSTLRNGEQSVAVLVHRWADALGVFPEEVNAARLRLLRFGLATWEDKGNVFALHRYWQTPVPAAIATPEHRAVLIAMPDVPVIVPRDDDER